jgi:hypothetical protein
MLSAILMLRRLAEALRVASSILDPKQTARRLGMAFIVARAEVAEAKAGAKSEPPMPR